MKNLWRKIRYRRELEEIEYHRNMRDRYIRAGDKLCEDFGLVRNQSEIARFNKFVEYHRSMIKHLKAQIYGGAK